MNQYLKQVKQLSDHTYEMQDSQGKRYICKRYSDGFQSQDCLNIFKMLQSYPCSNIVKVLNVVDDNVVLEKCDIDLDQYMKRRKEYRFKNDEIINVLSQIVNGYQHLRNLKIIHRQLSPKNILIRQIGAYNLVKVLILPNRFQTFQFLNQPQMNWQEQLLAYQFIWLRKYQKTNHFILINVTFILQQVSIKQLGIILYQLCYGEAPFEARSLIDIGQFHNIIKNCPFKCRQSTNQLFADLIEKMIVYNPEDRITWEQLFIYPQLQAQIKIIGNYLIDLNKKLGSGTQGTVYEVIEMETEEQCCAKIINNKSTEGQREKLIYQEIRNQKQLTNVIKILDIQDEGCQTFLFLEKCDENLLQYSQKQKQINDEIVGKLLKSVVNGYLHLRNLNIMHRDLKPENIMIKYEGNEPIFKIIDFGIGKIIDKKSQVQTMAGTPIHTAPEILFEYPYNDQCDIFSLGTILYWFIFRKQYCNPVCLEDLKDQVQSLKIHHFKCQKSEYITEKYTKLIDKMLIFDAQERITWEQLKAELEDNQPAIIQQSQYYSTLMNDCQDLDLKYLDSLYIFANKVQVSFSTLLKQQTQKQLIQLFQNLLTFISYFNLAILYDIYELKNKGTCLISYNQSFIQLQTKNINTIDETKLFNQIKAQEEFLQEIEKKIKYQPVLNLIDQYKNLSVQQRLSCGDAHLFYKNYYLEERQAIKNQENIIPIKERFYLEKLANIFDEYPLNNRSNINFINMAGKIIVQHSCEAYLNEKFNK